MHDSKDGTHSALHHGCHLCVWARVAAYSGRHAKDIRHAMTASRETPPAARTIAVLRTHEARRYAWRGRRGTTRRSSSRSSASAHPGDQHVPQAGREGAEDTLRGLRKARPRARHREHGKVSTRAHRVGRRSALRLGQPPSRGCVLLPCRKYSKYAILSAWQKSTTYTRR